uniref:CC domain-containing protein n=1 Tax=Ditylenchus dipsaci TaxID=166011 RepID=A0A915DAM5_9BILA
MLSAAVSNLFVKTLLVVTAACLVTGVDRSRAMGPCVDEKCPMMRMADEAVAMSIGSCVNNLCPKGYDCVDNNCYKSASAAKMAIGPCINNKCPDGFTCNESDYKCYP